MEKETGLRSTNWQLLNSHGDAKSSIGTIISNIVISVYGARWGPHLPGGSFPKLYKCPATVL